MFFLALTMLLGGCVSLLPPEEVVPNPPASIERGAVFLFAGFTWSSEGTARTGTDALAEAVRRRGVYAELERPDLWEATAERVLRDPMLRDAPIAVYGFSAGAPAALRFAGRLGEAGVPVQTLLALEAHRPIPVPCNVRAAVHLYLSDGIFSVATPISPARPGCTRIVNLRFNPSSVAPETLDHVSVSYVHELHDEALRIMLDGSRVRHRPAP